MFDDDALLALGDVFSHEFKTPLAAIRSYVNIIQRRYEEGSIDSLDMRMTTNAILHCCNNLSRLSSNVSLASKEGKIKAERFYYNVGEQLHTICFMANELFADSNVKIVFTPKSDPLIFNLDPDLIMSILLNLISNGIKYNSSAEKLITITAEVKKDKFYLTVKDNGTGFPKEEAEKVFERYYRVDNRFSMLASGLGLGLFIVKKMVTAHNGTVVAKPTNKSGTTFKIEIPNSQDLMLRSPQLVYVSADKVKIGLSGELPTGV